MKEASELKGIFNKKKHEHMIVKMNNQVRMIAEIIEQGKRERIFRNINSINAARILLAIQNMYFTSIIFDKPTNVSKKQSKEILDIFMNGIGK